MKEMKTKKKGAALIWGILTVILLVLNLVLNVLARGQLSGLMDTVFGGKRPIYADGMATMYPALHATSKEEALKNAQDFNIELAREGFVLLKNKDQALPLKKGAKISVFGKNSVDLSYGGSGSGGFDTSNSKTLYDSLEAAGFSVNRTLKDFYLDTKASGPVRAANSNDLDSGSNQKIGTAETPQSSYTQAVKDSYASYKDAALVVITRIGGEGFDLPRYQGDTAGAASPDSHYLLATVCAAGFEHVIVIFNIPSGFEATFLTDPAYADFADKIDGAVWIGFTGVTGIMALGEVLTGEVNPSGHLVDTWPADFTQNPTFVNFGTGAAPDSTDKYDSGMYYFVDYEEGIYEGYRYYETRGFTDGEEWYRKNVVFPFGYGLSYTTFEWKVGEPSSAEIRKDGTISVSVEVKNTGSVAGKDVVQLYVGAPYTAGGIEKAYKVLAGFAKTKLLAPGETDTVTVEFDPYTVASYDYRDANENGFAGYELEAGEYALFVSHNAHVCEKELAVRLSEEIRYEEDPVTGNTVENRYTGREDVLDSDWQLSTVLSRADWEGTWPDAPTAEEHAGNARLYEEIKDVEHNNPTTFDEEEYPWFDEEVVSVLRDLLPEETPEMTHKPIVAYDDERWDEILNACNDAEMLDLINYGAYHTLPMEKIGLPSTIHGDGPSGFTCFLDRKSVV